MMKEMILDLQHLGGQLREEEITDLYGEVNDHIQSLHEGTGMGSNFLGWLDLPGRDGDQELRAAEEMAARWKGHMDYVVLVGIGGSYLGARFVIEALSHSFSAYHTERDAPKILYAGNNLSEDYLFDLLSILEGKSFGLIVVSKSGTTTEPAVAFRILKNELIRRFGKKALHERIIAITDSSRGALRRMADEEGYPNFVIPDNIGGRYSVLTPVGLVPIAMAGFDIRALLEGARNMMERTRPGDDLDKNPAARYAIVRNLLYRKGKLIEILANYEPRLNYLGEWWKQLYGESEGKDYLGLFPASVNFTADLHSMGQYIQDGQRHLFETVLSVARPRHRLEIPHDEQNLDTLNFLAGKRIDEVNKMAEYGTTLAHTDGEVPNIRLEIPELKEEYLGQLIYFFEKACAISGYILGINPFNQPGVEAYKKNMFALLGKPGSEEEGKKLRERLGRLLS